MGLIPEMSFTVRKPAWWDDKAEYVLMDYPGRDEAMRLAGHDFDIIELPSFTAVPTDAATSFPLDGWQKLGNGWLRKDDGYKSHVRNDTGLLLHKSRETFHKIDNSVAYDIAELLFEQGFVYETAGSMDGGRQNYVTLLLNEPVVIEAVGEASKALPFGCLSWAHDGSASLKVRSGTIVQVCQNTVSASEAEGERLGTQFTFRHTKNWRERVEDAKKVVHGLRESVDVYRQLMDELADITVTPQQRELFVADIIGDRNFSVSNDVTGKYSDRVKSNVERERSKVLGLFMGQTIPEGQELTGYGLFQAGVEYFDHLRNFKSQDSYVRRTLLTDNPAKANLAKTVRELVAA